MKEYFSLIDPEDVALNLANKVKSLRLQREWKQTTLADRAGVTLASYRRFERTGQVSLQSLLKIAFALDRLDEFEELLKPMKVSSMAELESTVLSKKPKRGLK